jgi:hypothetical protein
LDSKFRVGIIDSKWIEFWNAVYNSLRQGIFTTLARIFENKAVNRERESFSLIYFFNFCKENRDIFSKKSLQRRKAEKLSPEKTMEFMDSLPSEELYANKDFKKCEKKINKWKAIFNDRYRVARNKLIAHRDIKNIGKENQLLAETSFKEVEQMIDFLVSFRISFYQLYSEGKKLELSVNENENRKHYLACIAREALEKFDFSPY